MRFENQIAIVTGAGRGMGKTITERFVSEGAKVVLVARHKEEIEKVAKQVKENGRETLCQTADISIVGEMEKVTDFVIKKFGRIDILVTCAAAGPAVGPSESLSLDEWRKVIDTDLTGTFLTCQSVGKYMLKQNYGRIVNIASFHALATYPQRAAYAAAKAGVCGLTRALAIEWARKGVTVNAVCPGPIRTPRTSWFLSQDPTSEKAMLNRTPSIRLGETEDVASLVLFLASQEANHIIGQTIVIDGGWSVSAWFGKYE